MDNLGIDDFNYHENVYTRGGWKYSVNSLIEASKDLVPFKMPMCGIDIGVEPWGKITIKKFAYHMKRINSLAVDYPVILDDTGYICDGWHRVVMAIIRGDEYIMAKRLTVMPENIGKDE